MIFMIRYIWMRLYMSPFASRLMVFLDLTNSQPLSPWGWRKAHIPHCVAYAPWKDCLTHIFYVLSDRNNDSNRKVTAIIESRITVMLGRCDVDWTKLSSELRDTFSSTAFLVQGVKAGHSGIRWSYDSLGYKWSWAQREVQGRKMAKLKAQFNRQIFFE